jgi:ribose transport system substrate-binding protein
MRSSPRVLLALVVATFACAGGAPGGESPQSSANARLSVAVVPKGTSHEFWKSIHAGAVRAMQELTAQGDSVTIIWKGPIREDDREQQVQVVESFVSQRIAGIVLAPLDRRALVRPVEEARRAGVPTIIIDSGLDSDSIVSYVATDNLKGGRLAAGRLAELLGGTGTVLLLRYQEGSASTMDRERGFLEEMREKHPDILVISSDQYAGPTRETAKRAAENLLNRHGADLHGVFTPNESSTIGMLLALQDLGRAGKVKHIGFDAAQSLVAALKTRELGGLVVQNPMRMGYLGVKMMVDHLRGRPVDRTVDTGVMLVTPENIDTPEAMELLNPPIDRYLSGESK